MTSYAAIILTGGRARRMGGVTKPLLQVGGQALLSRTVAAARASGCSPIVAVGTPLAFAEEADLVWVQEQPPFSGPAAAIAAAVAEIAVPQPEWTVVCAGDLVHGDQVIRTLQATVAGGAVRDSADGVAFTAHGHTQWLAAAYRTEALRAATLAQTGQLIGLSARALLTGLPLHLIDDATGLTCDIDTPADLARARSDAPRTHEEP